MSFFRTAPRARHAALSLLSVVLLAACGGSGSSVVGSPERSSGSSGSGLDTLSPPPLCQFMPAGSTVTSKAGCADCQVTDAEKAIDGNLDSAATLGFGILPAAHTDSLRAIAPPGVVFAALNQPGGFLGAPAVAYSNAIVISTYLDDVLQESTQATYQHIGGTGGDYWSIVTTKPFNAIEFTATMTAGTGNFTVNEICVDGGF